MIGAAVASIFAGGGIAALLANAHETAGSGTWNQSDVRTFAGRLAHTPYPALLTHSIDGSPRTAFLVSNTKRGLQNRLRYVDGASVRVRGTLIARGDKAMIAVVDGEDWMAPAAAEADIDWPEIDEGPATLTGEVLDAKCWFGAMRPGAGKVHKSCAALCIRGGLPPAFCANGCGDSADIFLFLDADGSAHGRELLPLVADPIMAHGRLFRVGDVRQFRVSLADVHRF